MVQPKWIIFLLFVWITLGFLGATLEQHTGTTWEGITNQTTLEYLLDMKNITYDQSATGIWSFVKLNPAYFGVILKCMTWDFDFMQTDIGEMVRWIIFIPFSIGMAAMFIFEFILLIQGFIPFT